MHLRYNASTLLFIFYFPYSLYALKIVPRPLITSLIIYLNEYLG